VDASASNRRSTWSWRARQALADVRYLGPDLQAVWVAADVLGEEGWTAGDLTSGRGSSR